MEKNPSYELILSSIEEVCQTIGIALNCPNLANIDLLKLYEELENKLGRNTAAKILKLAEKIASGLKPDKELTKLQNKINLLSSEQPQIDLNAFFVNSEVPELTSFDPNGDNITNNATNATAHWSKRTKLARERLPSSRGHFAKWSPSTIFRGPKTTREK